MHRCGIRGLKGEAYWLLACAAGLRQSLATAGALLGSSVSGLVFIATGQSYEATFVAATIPPAIAVVWLMTVGRQRAHIIKSVSVLCNP